MVTKQILVVSEDPVFCKKIQNYSMDIYCMVSAIKAIASYMKENYCLAILDIMLKRPSDMELLQTIRNVKRIPIIVLSDSLKIEERIAFIRAGADACIEKPINWDILTAQMNSLIQLHFAATINQRQHDPIVCGDELLISLRYRQVLVDGQSLTLTRKEFDLLCCLARSPGQVFSRKQIYNLVWRSDVLLAVDETVKAHIKTLRKKLASSGKNYIQNIWGVGYKFVLPDYKK